LTAARDANNISIREVLSKYETEFAEMARATENGEFAFWVGSGISRKAPNLGDLIERAIDFLRVRAIDAATSANYLPAFQTAITLAKLKPADLEGQFGTPLAMWPQRDVIINELWNNYSRVLDIRIKGEPADFILWEAIDIRRAFADPAAPAAEHLSIAILILEGAVRTIASANWDGFIEAAVAKLSSGAQGVLQVVVDPNHLRDAAGRAKLLKFHGCIIHAAQDPATFRKYLTGSRTQITEWPDSPLFAAMRNAVIDIATNQKSLVLGLSIQDNNLQSIFSKAKQVNPWPWPCAPAAPGHVFCEDAIKDGQSDVLKIVYGDAYSDNVDAIHAGTHLRAWGEQALLALVLKLIADKLGKLMELSLREAGKAHMSAELGPMLTSLRNHIADLMVGDRTTCSNIAISVWSRLISIFRRGLLPANPDAYEVLSSSIPGNIDHDENAQAAKIGHLAIGLCLLEYGRAQGLWTLVQATKSDASAGALTARASWPAAPERPLFMVKSATEAIVLERNGVLANENSIVVHADDAWHYISNGAGGARRPRSAPGRSGRISVTHVSLGRLIDTCDNTDALKQQFVSETAL